METIEQYIEELLAQLEVEVDLHGSRTTMAHSLRQAIIKAQKEKEEQ